MTTRHFSRSRETAEIKLYATTHSLVLDVYSDASVLGRAIVGLSLADTIRLMTALSHALGATLSGEDSRRQHFFSRETAWMSIRVVFAAVPTRSGRWSVFVPGSPPLIVGFVMVIDGDWRVRRHGDAADKTKEGIPDRRSAAVWILVSGSFCQQRRMVE